MSIPKGWEEVAIGEICEKSFYGTSDATTDTGKYPVIKMNHMQNGGLILKDMSYIDYDEKTFNKYKLCKGDILLNRTNSYELVGKVSLFDLDGDYLTASYLVALRLNREKANPKFINEVLNTKKMQDKIRVYVTKGVSQANINPTIFKQHIRVPLPPLKEQEKIAEILGSCDEHIKNLKNLKSVLEKEKLHLMNELLSGKTRFANFTTPWQEVRLEDLALKMQSGGTPRATNKAYYGGNIPFVKISDITNSFKYLNDTEVKITELGLNNSSAWIVPKNSIIYSMYASVGFLAINTIEVATSQAMINIIPNLEKVDLNYLYYYLDDYKKYISKFIETGTQGNLNAQSVKSFTIKFPSLEEQKKIGEVLSACDEHLECLNELITAQTTLKSHLLTELLSGNIRVNA